ncbi:MAG: agmatine deiminase family protein [Alphaproteobacteria bacterium]|nr:MAG: agmatine deiminase family protein [Alphaproteobacteria bacterium]
MVRFDNSPAAAGYFLPPEWAPQDGCLIGWPVASDALAEVIDYARLAASALARHVAGFEPVIVVVRPEDKAEARLALGPDIELLTLDYACPWIRDTGPSLLVNEDACAASAWTFNGWGHRVPVKQDEGVAARLAKALNLDIYESALVLEGGAFEVDGRGTVLASRECLLSKERNPALNEAQVEERLVYFLGARNVVWVDDGFDGDTSGGRVGLSARFIGQDRILLNAPKEEGDPNRAVALNLRRTLSDRRCTHGHTYELIDVPQPEARFSMDGHRLSLSYLDFLFVNEGILLPAFDDPLDDQVARQFSGLFPGRDICQINLLPLYLAGGGIARMTLPLPAV